MIRKGWWKLLAFVLLFFTSIYGFIVKVPKLDDRLEHSIRNMFFHVPMWFAMMVLLFVSVWYAAKFLRTTSPIDDFYSKAFAATGTLYGFLGLSTGAIWANYQWGSPWSGDPKQNGAAIAMLIYLAYFVLRGSMTDEDKRSRIAAVYNIFAFLCSSQRSGFYQDSQSRYILEVRVVKATRVLMEKIWMPICVLYFIRP